MVRCVAMFERLRGHYERRPLAAVVETSFARYEKIPEMPARRRSELEKTPNELFILSVTFSMR